MLDLKLILKFCFEVDFRVSPDRSGAQRAGTGDPQPQSGKGNAQKKQKLRNTLLQPDKDAIAIPRKKYI